MPIDTDHRQSVLFTPGPLSTSVATKAEMMRDPGSRDAEFLKIVREVRLQLLDIAGVPKPGPFEVILMQGSGTFGVESVLSSVIPTKGKLLVAINGAYGERIAAIARRHGIEVEEIMFRENEPVRTAPVEEAVRADEDIVAVAVVHCETTTGLLNDVAELGAALKPYGRTFIVDAMSSFGVFPLDLDAAGVDFLITSANKCLEGVPGFALVFAHGRALGATEGMARTVVLDIHAQFRGLESNGQFRFTPPTHAILAFRQALREFESEGRIAGRRRRYQSNHDVLMEGMQALGFKPYLRPEHQSCIITTFHYPDDPRFSFEALYNRLHDGGLVIYPGKLTQTDCFRIGTVGQVFPDDVRRLLIAIEEAMTWMGVRMPLAHSTVD